MKPIVIILISLFAFSGCYYDYTENEAFTLNPEINFTISDQLANGNNVSAIAVIDENNYAYSVGNKIFQVENGQESATELPSAILALVWNKTDQSLWAGTHSSGLVCLKNGLVRYYNQKNSNLPRDMVRKVACDDTGNVWFDSSAHHLGGLGCCAEGEIFMFTPENSGLPDNLIKSIACSGGRVFVTTGSTVTLQKVLTVENGEWKTLPIGGYYLMDMDVDSEGRVYIIDDTGLSSSMMTNKIYLFDELGCRDILQEKSRFENNPYLLKTDLRNYLWVARFTNQAARNLAVYDGEKWHEAPESFPESFIQCMAVDQNNGIWLGTRDGIFVLKQ